LLAGGRQDRIVAKDTILPPKSGKTQVKVYCVEDARWSKEKKFKHAGYGDAALRKLLDSAGNQKMIWNEISRRFRKRKLYSKTNSYLALMGEKVMVDTSNLYFENLLPKFRSSDSSMIGFVAVTANQILGADVFISPELFFNNLEVTLKLYIDGAVAAGSPPVIPVKNIKDYCEQLFSPKTQDKFLRRYGNALCYNGQVIHITSY
ncbi:MAG: ARPP-1 family domain-containing protein, partial [Sphingobacteriales bacterium]